MKLTLRPIPLTEFVWDRTTRTFSAEISDLKARGHLVFQPLYDDAADRGFSILNLRTKNEVVYSLEREETQEGDVLKWVFTPTRESVMNHRDAVNTKVVIFND